MEYTQWDYEILLHYSNIDVLILVVMEYTQWAVVEVSAKDILSSLNPCCNGIYSMSISDSKPCRRSARS